MAKAPAKRIEAEVYRLYGLPLDEFTSARNEAAKVLRKDGDREGADRVAKLKKPDRVAWAINAGGRAAPTKRDRVLKAGADLRAAQDATISGRAKGQDLRKAIKAERDAVTAMVKAIREMADDVGAAAGSDDEIAATLHAAGSDEELAETISSGRLLGKRTGGGFGRAGGAAASVEAAPKDEKKSEAKRKAEATAQAKALRGAEAAAKKAESAESRADSRVDRATKKAEQARQELEAAQEELGEAKREAEAARAALERFED